MQTIRDPGTDSRRAGLRAQTFVSLSSMEAAVEAVNSIVYLLAFVCYAAGPCRGVSNATSIYLRRRTPVLQGLESPTHVW